MCKFKHLRKLSTLSICYGLLLVACKTDNKTPINFPVEPLSGPDYFPSWNINDEGQITHNQIPQKIQCASWHGLQGILPNTHENIETNDVSGAMELLIGNPWWVDSGRTYEQFFDEITNYGINTIRVPIAPETLDPTHPMGQGEYLRNSESVKQKNAYQALEQLIQTANQRNINIILSLHKCSNEVGWRAGSLDYDPGLDPGFSGTPDASCTDDGKNFNKEQWLNTLQKMAELPFLFNVDNIIGIDIYSEPWHYSWDNWKSLVDSAYTAITDINYDILIFVQAAATDNHGDEASQPNWSENFFPFKDKPFNIPRNRLVITPNVHGPSVYIAKHYLEDSCAVLKEQEASEAQCQIVIDKEKLRRGWEEHFGYLTDHGYTVLLGEFGGNLNWPEGGSSKAIDQWSHVPIGAEKAFQETLIEYMMDKNIQGCYWAVNPESSDDDFRGGLYTTPYIPIVNESGWGQWGTFDTEKQALLYKLWGIKKCLVSKICGLKVA